MEQPDNFKGKDFASNPENINRTGENRGSQWSKTIIRKYLDKPIKKENLNDEEEELPVGEHVVIAILKEALNGNYKAAKELLDRLEGTPAQTINQNNTFEEPLIINKKDNDPNLPDTETT